MEWTKSGAILAWTSLGWLDQVHGDTKHISITFIWVNGSLVPVTTSVEQEDASGPNISGTIIQVFFLIVIFIVGVIGNMFMTGTIWSSITLHRLPFNILLLNLGLICLLECLLNVMLSAVYLIFEPWNFGSVVCMLNSFFMEVLPVMYTFMLVNLCFDRALALRNPLQYKKSVLKARMIKCYLLFIWLLAILSASPVLINVLENWPFPVRYSCQPMHELTVFYGILTGIVCYLVAWLAMIVAMTLIQRYITSEKRKERKAMRGQQGKFSTHTAFFFANAHLWNELKNVMLISVLLIMYLVLMGPYVVRTKVDQITEVYDYDYYRNLTLPHYVKSPNLNATTTTTSNPTPTNAPNSPTPTSTGAVGDSNNDGLTQVTPSKWKRPEVKADFLTIMDTIFVWLRYIHAALVPWVIFGLHKDLRKKAKDLVCCFRPNSVENASPRPISAYLRRQRKELQKQKKKFKNITNYSVPVLFATSEGLHLRVVDDNHQGLPEHKGFLEESIKSQWTVDPEFLTEFCDLQVITGTETVPPSPRKQLVFGSTVTLEGKTSSSVREDEGFEEEMPLIKKDRDRRSKNPKVVHFDSNVEEIRESDLEPDPTPSRSRKHKKSSKESKGSSKRDKKRDVKKKLKQRKKDGTSIESRSRKYRR
ncbi:hypothetical protein TCAL_10565 [Tigriopus californicus]|uniref:G-protein coupled receptors family 1 profile domain-containing protein n=1 Tax=Tigriopus californicus TaxID=6832 RepID=A0A553PHR4_TIGCA|nr:uncharacterized protein LOC131880952 [Tigriopus californicus]TRY77226.1 hypothetical protein TCAL_10565 [Tigriopus californicus]